MRYENDDPKYIKKRKRVTKMGWSFNLRANEIPDTVNKINQITGNNLKYENSGEIPICDKR